MSENKSKRDIPMKEAILFENVSKSLSGQKILDNVSIAVSKGEIYGLLGANGAGKTSLIKMIYSMLTPDRGQVVVLGEKIERKTNMVYKKIGSIIEMPVFYEGMSAFRNLEIHCNYMGIKDRTNIVDIFEKVGLQGCEKTLVNKYSLGMKQRLAIGRALLAKPEILILDEPINGLDPLGINQFRELIINVNQQFNTTIFISSHILDEVAKVVDKVGVIHEGRMISELYLQEILSEESSLEEYYMKLIGKGVA